MIRCNAESRAYRVDLTEDGPVRVELGFLCCRHKGTRRVKGQPDLCARHRESIAQANPNVRVVLRG